MTVRGLRGATQAQANTRSAILRATRSLLREMARANRLDPGAIAAAFFTVTDDLMAEFPARAARAMGWTSVPMICNREIPVPGALPRVIRVLLLVNTPRPAGDLRHVYMGETACLRPDLAARAGARRRRPEAIRSNQHRGRP